MWVKLEEVFNVVGLPYYRQGSLSEDIPLEDSFFTYWNADTPNEGYYDNKESKNVWFWYIYFYAIDPDVLYNKLDDFIKVAKEKGFIASGRGKDIPSDTPSHLGRYLILKYIEPVKEETTL